MSIKYCIFDMGKVCYHFTSEPLNQYCLERTKNRSSFLEKKGVKSFDYNPLMLGQQSFTEFCLKLCHHCEMEYTKNIEKEIDNAVHQGVGEYFKETMATMDYLEKNNIEVCLLTNVSANFKDTIPQRIKKDKVFTSYELNLLKPDTAIYKTVLEKLSATPKEVIFIDDKEENVASAKSLGINGIVFDRATVLEKVKEVVENNKLSHTSL